MGIFGEEKGRSMKRGLVRTVMVLFITWSGMGGAVFAQQANLSPNRIEFWENSEHWTTNFGPAFRDTVQGVSYFLPCTEQFALCFHSGAAPDTCTQNSTGRFAKCICTVSTAVNYVLISAILNYNVYQQTVAACGIDGSGCQKPDSAPVCQYLANGKLLPGAKVISTYDFTSYSDVIEALKEGPSGVTQCTGAYAACMTAGCTLQKDGTALCKCPIFHGKFQLDGPDAQCNLGDNLVPSASYSPLLDSNLIP
jgi:hypothetical protein